jgi:hypothetical protein
MTLNGVSYLLPPSERLTSGDGSSVWPTPVAHDDGKTPEAHMRMKRNMPGGPRYKPTSLNVMVKGVEQGIWPTPTAADAKGSRRNTARTEDWTSREGVTLTDATRLWPTPTVRDSQTVRKAMRGDGSFAKGNEKIRPLVVQAWETNHDGKPTQPTGLNPSWVEWLMGFPVGWTDLEA